jgi:hypothetical protein
MMSGMDRCQIHFPITIQHMGYHPPNPPNPPKKKKEKRKRKKWQLW